jgi:hypothetical protein
MFINAWEKNNGVTLFTLGWIDRELLEFLIGLATELNFSISVDSEIIPIYAPKRDVDVASKTRASRTTSTMRKSRIGRKFR